MVKIVFRNSLQDKPPEKPEAIVFRAAPVRLASDCIWATINGREVPLAYGTGRIWRVGNRFFDNIEIQSTAAIRSGAEYLERKAAER